MLNVSFVEQICIVLQDGRRLGVRSPRSGCSNNGATWCAGITNVFSVACKVLNNDLGRCKNGVEMRRGDIEVRGLIIPH